VRLALDTDPVSALLHWGVAWSLYYAKQYREAIEYGRRSLEIDPNFSFSWFAIGLAQLREGLPQEAISSFQRVVELTPWMGGNAWSLATAYHQAGDHARSEELARKLAASYGQCYWAGFYYAATGEVDAMFDALDGAYQQRERLLIDLKNESSFDPYRTDPRFQALLAKMKLA
jgi:tetratricopeptide (TPR) repeat protein